MISDWSPSLIDIEQEEKRITITHIPTGLSSTSNVKNIGSHANRNIAMLNLMAKVEARIPLTPIIGVAIKVNGLVVALPKPNRHHDCIRWAVEVLGLDFPITNQGQGFYLSNGTYLTRTEAKRLALLTEQIKATNFDELYSEDLW